MCQATATMEKRTIVNRKSGDEITTTLSNYEAAEQLSDAIAEDSWLWFWIHKAVADAEAAPKIRNVLDIINAMFVYAIGSGLKRPKLYVVYKDVRYYFYLSGRGTLCIKAANRRNDGENTWSDRGYIGCIWDGKLIDKGFNGDHKEFFATLTDTDDVTRFLAECSKAANTCCYCGAELSDETSKALGYGQTCAKRWGLTWGKKAVAQAADETPSFAHLAADPNVQALIAEIISTPLEATPWGILSDYCEDKGVRRVDPPQAGTIIPSKGAAY